MHKPNFHIPALLAITLLFIANNLSAQVQLEPDTQRLPVPDFKKMELEAPQSVKLEIQNLQNVIKQKKYSFKIGITSVSTEPIKKITGSNSFKSIDKDYADYVNSLADKALSKTLFSKITSGSTIPGTNVTAACTRSFFMTPNLPPVRSQKTCGSCWAFAATAVAEISFLQRFNSVFNLSEQELIDCTTPLHDGCDGFNSLFPFLYMQAFGVVREVYYRYVNRDNGSCTSPSEKKYKLRAWGFAGIPSTIPNSVSEIKNAIREHGAVAASIAATELFKDYSNGIFDEIPPGQPYDLNHAIVIVGWDDCRQAWRVLNSWGRGWGEDGYAWVKYGYNGIGAFASWVEAADPNPPSGIIPGLVEEDISEGTYYFKCAVSEKYLDVSGSCVNENGCKVQLWDIGKSPRNNQFRLRKVGGILGGYTIQCVMGGKYLDGNLEPNAPLEFDFTPKVYINGTRLQVWDRGCAVCPRMNQEWGIKKLSNGKYKIFNIQSGKVLDAKNDDVNRNGGKVQLWTSISNDRTQEWILQRVP